MTPPVQNPTLSAAPSNTTLPEKPKPEPAKPIVKETVVADLSSTKRWIPSLSLGVGFGAQGTNGSLFNIRAQSGYNDYRQVQVSATVMRDLLGDTVRFRVGPRFDFNYTQGNENTAGSNYTQGTIGAQLEVDWLRVYKAGLLGMFKGPSYVNLNGGIGGGAGTGTATEGPRPFSLHEQKGVAAVIGLGLNILNANIRRLQLGLDFVFQTNGIFGQSHNSTGNYVGFAITTRPGINKVEIEIEKEVCRETKGQIDNYVARNAEVRKKNGELKEDLDTLRGFLEKGKNPITTERIQRALTLREVRIEILKALPNVKEELVRNAVKAAFLAKSAREERAAFSKIPGLTSQLLEQANQAALKKYPVGYDFWAQITIDPVPATVPNPLPEDDCKAMNQILDDVIKEHIELTKRNRDITGRMDTAILLDALRDALGEDVTKFVQVYKATVMDFPNPQFRSGFPKSADVERLKAFVAKTRGTAVVPENTELIKLLQPVFANPIPEAKKAKKMADQMNGRIELPGEQEAAEEAKKAGKTVPPPDREWIKNLKFTVEGHTDSVPFKDKNDSNQKLSDRRAEYIMLMFTLYGVDPTRLRSIGYGASRPVIPEVGKGPSLVDARTQNRRTVIRIWEATLGPSAPLANQGGNIDPHTPATQIKGVDAEGNLIQPNAKAKPVRARPKPAKPVQPKIQPAPAPNPTVKPAAPKKSLIDF